MDAGVEFLQNTDNYEWECTYWTGLGVSGASGGTGVCISCNRKIFIIELRIQQTER